MWDKTGECDSYLSIMTDFLETPAGDFEWGPDRRRLPRVRRFAALVRTHLPSLAIGAGFTLLAAGLILLVSWRKQGVNGFG